MSAVRGDAPAGPAPGLARGLQQSDIRAVEGDIRSAEDAGTSGLARIRSLRPSSDRDGSPAFSADEYVKRRRRRALLARCAAAAVFFLIVCPFGAGIWVANRNKTALDEARAAMGRGEFDEARARLAGAGEFWVGREAIAALGDEIGFREALVPADEAERAGDLARAAAAVAAARERFPRFAEEAQKRERRLLCAVQLAAGERAERAGDLAGAVAAYDRARQHAQPDDRRAADRIEAIRKALEADIEAAKEARDLERQLVAMRRLRAVFGGGAADIERLELEIGLRDEMAKGDKAAEGRDYEGALDHYYRASEAATKLGRAREIADLEARTRRARKRANFQRFFNEGEALELKGRYAEAIQAYSRARSWITPPVASAPPPLGPPVLSGMTGAAAPPAAEESDGGLASLLDARVRACEEARARDEGEAQASRLWREAIDALRASRVDQAVAALEALSRARPREDKVRNALAFARSLGDAVYVPAGEAVIGSSAQGAEKDEFPEHKVSIPAFFADRYEVRNREYAAFVEATGAAPPEHWLESRGDGAARVRARTYAPEHADHPVVNVSFFEAERYAAWAKKRLPTEEEWEKAARGTEGRLFPWGASPEGAKANVGAKISDRIAIGTKPVGTSPGDVSPFGCSDMGGNVSEWTASPYRPYRGNQAKGIEWSDEQRVIRGGSWRYEWSYARCSNRDRSRPEKRYPEVGFRCVVDVPDWLPELK
jgi:serine/threonine-protein kinase